jgi:hypothetical protein
VEVSQTLANNTKKKQRLQLFSGVQMRKQIREQKEIDFDSTCEKNTCR